MNLSLPWHATVRPMFVLLALAACRSSTLPHPGLDRAERLWQEVAPPAYEVEMRITCFCLPVLAEWSRVTVGGGKVIGVVAVEGGEAVSQELWPAWPTVDELFDRIRAGPDGEVIVRIDAEYHDLLGYPTRADFIESEFVADAAINYTLRNLAAIDN